MSKKQLLVIATLASLIALSSFTYHQGVYTFWSLGTVQRINPSIAKQLLQNEALVILDARSEEEFEVSHLPNAIRYTPETLDSLSLSQPVLIYCTIGVRSNSLAKDMDDQGFQQLYEIKGGLINWANAQFDMVDIEQKPTNVVHTYHPILAPLIREGTAVY